jgi:CheY-like chemotaxis protein
MARILVVEDEIALAEVYSFVLKHKGHKVWTAGDGQLALDKLAVARPDIILLDMMMPHMGGIEFLENYQKQKPQHVKIIILSNMQSREHETRARELGADRYEIKASVSPEQLLKMVDEALKG